MYRCGLQKDCKLKMLWQNTVSEMAQEGVCTGEITNLASAGRELLAARAAAVTISKRSYRIQLQGEKPNQGLTSETDGFKSMGEKVDRQAGEQVVPATGN